MADPRPVGREAIDGGETRSASDESATLIPPAVVRIAAVLVGIAAVATPIFVLGIDRSRTPSPAVLKPLMILVPAGSFEMGSPETEKDHQPDETLHRVELPRPFWLSATEVTQDQYFGVTGQQPSSDQACGGDCPVESVTWLDAVMYCNKLSELESVPESDWCYEIRGSDVSMPNGLNCEGYRLPTEAEWEYAARADTRTPYVGTADDSELERVCRYDNVCDKSVGEDCPIGAFDCDDGHKRVAPVASYRPNPWHFQDMGGNVAEWVWDIYGPYGSGTEVDPMGADSGSVRVIRGGTWWFGPFDARVAGRVRGGPSGRYGSLGFRVARSHSEPAAPAESTEPSAL